MKRLQKARRQLLSVFRICERISEWRRAVHSAAAIFQFSSEARLINIDSMAAIRQKGDENESK
jgi:lipopolysaccharide biosynthesis regulator YciM